MKTKIFTLLFALIASTCALFATEFQFDDYYLFASLHEDTYTATITGYMQKTEAGRILHIPEFLHYDNNTYVVTQIGYQAFAHAGLTSVYVPKSVTYINDYAFRDCRSLTTITIGSGVSEIAQSVFSRCDSLTEVHIYDLAAWCKISGQTGIYWPSAWRLYLDDKEITDLVIPNSVDSINPQTFSSCKSLKSVVINNSVKSIEHSAFAHCSSLTSVIIGDNVTSIENGAFAECSQLKYVEMGKNVETIEGQVFDRDSALEAITIPVNVTSIGSSVFSNCVSLNSIKWEAKTCRFKYNTMQYDPFKGLRSQITSFTFGDAVDTIPLYLCSEMTSLTSITIPNSVKTIETRAFEECTDLKSVSIGNGVTNIEYCAFYKCSSLSSITMGNSVKNIEESAFSDCTGLTSVHISDISAWCAITFGGSDSNPLVYAHNLYLDGELITNLTIPSGVTSIGNSAFSGCTSFTSVTIPNNVTSIGENAFSNCTGLTSVHISDIPAWCAITFGDAYSNPLYYAHNLYLDGELITNLTIPSGVTRIGSFSNCTSLISVTIPNSVTSIRPSAFSGCTGLTSITIPNSVDSIGSSAFSKCFNINSLIIPNSVTSIGNNAFKLLPNVEYSGSATGSPWGARSVNGFIDGWFVYNNSSKTKILACQNTAKGDITLMDNVTSIGNYAFYQCKNITSINIPSNVTNIGECAFQGCKSITSISVPTTVTSIGGDAFGGLPNVAYSGSATGSPWGARSVNGFVDGWLVYNSAEKLHLKACSGNATGDISLPISVKYIGVNAFLNCDKLTSITIPQNVTGIFDAAFNQCTGLNSLICLVPTPLNAYRSFSGLDCSNVSLYVPAESVELYEKAEYWKDFGAILPIEASKVDVTEFSAAWSGNNILLSWPVIENAETYTIEVKDNEENVVCVLVFNAQGELQSLHYAAPVRNGNKKAQTATQTSEGWQYVLNSLDPDKQYIFTLVVTDSENNELYSKTITNSSAPTSIENTLTDTTKSTKLLHNGQILILRGDKTYTLQGQEVK